MPIRDRYDADRNILFVTFEGVLTDEDLLKYAQRAAESTQAPPGRDELLDLRDVTGDVATGTLQQVAQLFTATDETPEQSRVAIVASGDLAFGLSRAYQAYRSASPLDLRVFRTMEEARTWLGLAPD